MQRQYTSVYTPIFNSKQSIVKNALLETYKFLSKLRQDHGEFVAELIIVPFNTCADIYSTINITDVTDPAITNKITVLSFNDMKRIIEDVLVPSGGTDFESIEIANSILNTYLQSYLEANKDNLQIIKYIMSDGSHNNKPNCTRLDLLQLPGHTYEYSLGIGKGNKDYDEELLRHMGKTFVDGNDSTTIEESIIGDTFNCTNVIATNLQISVITTANVIGCSHNVIKTEPFDNTTKFTYDCDDFHVDTTVNPTDQLTIIKLTGNITEQITSVNKKTIFIFYVDVSGSMSEPIIKHVPAQILHPNMPAEFNELVNTNVNFAEVSPDEVQSMVELEQNEIEINDISVQDDDSNLKFAKRRRLESDIKYYRHVLEMIPKFNIITEMFAMVPHVTGLASNMVPQVTGSDDTKEIILELSYIDKNGNQVIKYIKCNSNNKIDATEIDIMSKCCYLRDKLCELGKASKKERVQMAKILDELVRCPIYNNIIADQTNLSPTKALLFGIVENVKKVTEKAIGKSEIMFNQMLADASKNITRTTSCTQSRAYSTCLATPSTYTDIGDSTTCVICHHNPRSVVYDCGHCVACKYCTKQIFFNIDEEVELSRLPSNIFETTRTIPDEALVVNDPNELNLNEQRKKCPICMRKVQNVRLLMLFNTNNSIRCNETGCDNIARYISSACGHLTYCNRCIIGKTHCPCGVKLHKLKRVFF